ncbi:MAG: 4-(cytidine 5'-diphospho)-2-C-methyl-D-erythritol kinase [Treponema sp.]|nr:4-(cytidine 5'-diphospho)-2-C-methyl-D-erythritol kinase [Treponema sp.]
MDSLPKERTSVNERVVQVGCKINLHLEVKDRRPDGYHNLESIFIPLKWGDILSFTALDQRLSCDLRVFWNVPHRKCIETFQKTFCDMPVEKNIVYKALSLFRERTGWDRGIRIALEKKVPLAAGLGGGSADAAAALRTLDDMAETRLPFDELREMAAELGSDVPFFLYKTPAYVSGRGERIQKAACPWDFWALLVVPDFESGTASAFRALDKERENGAGAPKPSLSGKELMDGLKDHPSNWRYCNDFLSFFLEGEHKKEYFAIFETLKHGGADFYSLSGSGSCCFGVFTHKQAAESTERVLAEGKNFVQIIHFTSCIF